MPITAEINLIISSKIAPETPPKILRRIFWCNKNFFGLIFRRKFHRKWTGNEFSRVYVSCPLIILKTLHLKIWLHRGPISR